MNVKLATKSIYNNKLLCRGLEYAAEKTPTFIAGTTLILSALRPVTILAAPKTDRENKKLACAKSIASAGINYSIMWGLTKILTKGIKGIENNPSKYLKKTTIKTLQETGKPLYASKKYQFLAQLFKLGLGFTMAIPKSALTCAMIPGIMDKVLNRKNRNPEHKIAPAKTGNISFKGGAKLNPLSKGIGKVMDKPFMHKMAERFKDSNYPMHIPVMGDILSTAAFVHQTNKSKKIKQERKRVLNNNAKISTTLSIAASYIVDKMLDKPTEKFIKKLAEANKESPKLAKYIEGVRIAKPTLIMGGIYYIAIPLISTFLADRVKTKNPQ